MDLVTDKAISRAVFCVPGGTVKAVAEDGVLVRLTLRLGAPDGAEDVLRDPVLIQTRAELLAYFAGERRQFTVPVAQPGSFFAQSVWQALRDIPYGTTCSYGELARRLGRAGAARAVGVANGCNRLAIIVPCHRVIGANGRLVGYNGGLELKRWLLEHEAWHRLRGGSRAASLGAVGESSQSISRDVE